MDRTTLSRLPFLTAFFIAVAAMPLDIYNFNQRNIGTAVLSPWQRGISAAVDRVRSFGAAILAFLRSPGLRYGLAATLLVLAMSGHLPHGDVGWLCVGLTDPKEMREQINKLGTDMVAITAKCKEEKREMTREEEQSFDKMDAEREDLLKKERRALAIQELETGVGRRAEPRQPNSEIRTADADAEQLAEGHNDALRAWFASQLGIPLTREQQELCARHRVNLSSQSINIRRPKVGLRSLSLEHERQWESRARAMFRSWKAGGEQRALSTLTSTSPEDGSYLIANEAMLPIERALLTYGNVRAVSTVLRTRTGANLPIPTNDDTSNEGALLAENTQAVDKDPAFGQLVLGAFKFTSKKVRISRELFQDSNEDLGVFMFNMLGERLARIMNRYATTGTGTNEPKGIVTGSTASGTQLAAKTPTYVELVAIEGALDPAYRTGGSWMFHDTLLSEIKKIVDGSQRPLWLPSMSGGAPDRILGYPYEINQHMAVAAASGAGKSILFGNMRKYLFREVQDIEVIRLNELYAEYYQVAFVGFARMDGDLLDAGTHPVVHGLNKA